MRWPLLVMMGTVAGCGTVPSGVAPTAPVYPVPLSAPKQPASTNTYQVTLGWNPVAYSSALSYQLLLAYTNNGKPFTLHLPLTSSTVQTVSGLSYNVLNYFTVRSYASANLTSNWSAPLRYSLKQSKPPSGSAPAPVQ